MNVGEGQASVHGESVTTGGSEPDGGFADEYTFAAYTIGGAQVVPNVDVKVDELPVGGLGGPTRSSTRC